MASSVAVVVLGREYRHGRYMAVRGNPRTDPRLYKTPKREEKITSRLRRRDPAPHRRYSGAGDRKTVSCFFAVKPDPPVFL